MGSKSLVFVFDAMQSGYSGNLVLQGDATLLGRAETKERLFSMLVSDEIVRVVTGKSAVHGEVCRRNTEAGAARILQTQLYEVGAETLQMLDTMERVSGDKPLAKRTGVDVVCEEATRRAWIYVSLLTAEQQEEEWDVVEEGRLQCVMKPDDEDEEAEGGGNAAAMGLMMGLMGGGCGSEEDDDAEKEGEADPQEPDAAPAAKRPRVE